MGGTGPSKRKFLYTCISPRGLRLTANPDCCATECRRISVPHTFTTQRHSSIHTAGAADDIKRSAAAFDRRRHGAAGARRLNIVNQ